VIENKGSASDFVRAVRAIRQVDCTCGHLRGEAEQVLCDSSARLDSPTEFARERRVAVKLRPNPSGRTGLPCAYRNIRASKSNGSGLRNSILEKSA
jgi:hypothetical protein